MVIIEQTNRPETADISALAIGLDEHAAGLAPPRQKGDIGLFVRAEDGRILAGLFASTYWGWLHIKLLWLDESLRGQGVGRQMMQMAEAEALARDCHAAMVDTHSFQAEGFYKGLGYEVFGRLPDFPPGHERIYLRKLLVKRQANE